MDDKQALIYSTDPWADFMSGGLESCADVVGDDKDGLWNNALMMTMTTMLGSAGFRRLRVGEGEIIDEKMSRVKVRTAGHSVTGFLERGGPPRVPSLKKVGVCVWKAGIWLDEREARGSNLQKILESCSGCDGQARTRQTECMTGRNALREEPVGAIFEGCAI